MKTPSASTVTPSASARWPTANVLMPSVPHDPGLDVQVAQRGGAQVAQRDRAGEPRVLRRARRLPQARGRGSARKCRRGRGRAAPRRQRRGGSRRTRHRPGVRWSTTGGAIGFRRADDGVPPRHLMSLGDPHAIRTVELATAQPGGRRVDLGLRRCHDVGVDLGPDGGVDELPDRFGERPEDRRAAGRPRSELRFSTVNSTTLELEHVLTTVSNRVRIGRTRLSHQSLTSGDARPIV